MVASVSIVALKQYLPVRTTKLIFQGTVPFLTNDRNQIPMRQTNTTSGSVVSVDLAQHKIEQFRLLMAGVLLLKHDPASPPQSGSSDTFTAPKRSAAGTRVNEGILILTAAITDESKGEAMPRRCREARVEPHSRRNKKAVLHVREPRHGLRRAPLPGGGLVGHCKDGTQIFCCDLNPTGISRITVRAGCFATKGGTLELCRDSLSFGRHFFGFCHVIQLLDPGENFGA